MKMSVLASVWLDELGLLHRIDDDMTKTEAARMIAKAEKAALDVENAFAEQKAAGRMKELSQTYRKARHKAMQSGKRFVPWPAFLMDQKRTMVRSLAQEQRSRARRGIKP